MALLFFAQLKKTLIRFDKTLIFHGETLWTLILSWTENDVSKIIENALQDIKAPSKSIKVYRIVQKTLIRFDKTLTFHGETLWTLILSWTENDVSKIIENALQGIKAPSKSIKVYRIVQINFRAKTA